MQEPASAPTLVPHSMQWYALSANQDSMPVAVSSLSPSHRAVAYGDGFFTTMGVQSGQVLWQSYHQRRLITHADALCISLDADRLARLWRQVASCAQKIGDGIIKVMVSRHMQNLRGYGFVTDELSNQADIWLGVLQKQPTVTPTTSELSDCFASDGFASDSFSSIVSSIMSTAPITAVTLSTQIGCLPPSLVGLKTLNRLDNVMAAAELEQKKRALRAVDFAKKQPKFAITEGLVKDVSGQWVEGTMSNVFYQLKHDGNTQQSEQWYTPPIDVSGVNGVMRQVIIDKLKAEMTPVIERRLSDTDLPQLSAMFFCNAVRGVMPVGELILADDQRVDLQGVEK